MQLLDLSFLNAKYTTYLIIILEFSNQFRDSYLSIHSLYYHFFSFLKFIRSTLLWESFFSIAKITS